MADEDELVKNAFFRGQNPLGKDVSLQLTGTGAMPGGAASALPAPAGPGGVGGGFLGGGRGQGAAQGTGGAGDLAKQALEGGAQAAKIGEKATAGGMPPGTLGELYGPKFQAWMGNTSPTDYFKSLTDAGLSPSDANDVMSMMTQDPEVMNALGASGAGAGGASLGLSEGLGLGASALGGAAGAYGLAQGIQSGNPRQALSGAAGLYSGAAPVVNAALGTELPTLGTLAGSVAPELAAEAAGTTAASGAAAGTVGLAAAPIAAAFIAAQVNDMMEAQENASRTAGQYKSLTSSIPGQAAMIEQAPALLQQLQNASPEEAMAIYTQLQDMQKTFGGSGMEHFLETGSTGSSYGSSPMNRSIMFPQGPAIYNQLNEYLGAQGLGTVRAQDIMAKAGVTPEGAWDPQTAALQLGGERYNTSEAGAPAFSTRYNPYLTENYQKPTEAKRAAAKQQADLEAMMEGREPNLNADYSNIPAVWSPQALQDFAGIQPGGLEAGLMKLFGNQVAPQVQRWLPQGAAATPEAVAQQGQADQIAQGALGGGGVEGLLSDEQKRAMGLM